MFRDASCSTAPVDLVAADGIAGPDCGATIAPWIVGHAPDGFRMIGEVQPGPLYTLEANACTPYAGSPLHAFGALVDPSTLAVGTMVTDP